MSTLAAIITADDQATRDAALDAFCRAASAETLLAECEALERLRRGSANLYESVRALFFLYAVHRFHLPFRPGVPAAGHVPYRGHVHLLNRRFEEAIGVFRQAQAAQGPSAAVSSALAAAYYRLGFQTLADQVRRSVRSVRGNQWMFRVGHPADQPLRVRPELLARPGAGAPFPVLREATPVRMDLSHSAWSDIFFLGMDFPAGARVLNVSIDLGVRGRDPAPRPPVEASLRVIDEPVLRLTSVDLGASADIVELAEVFDYARDYLGLLKAAVIASGIVPPGIEGAGQSLADLLARLTAPGHGIELVSAVSGIPKGSRLAVSTSLLACLIAVCMRATGQARSLRGQLAEGERRLVAARAILGEWLAGSGGGWQDSGGVWPGMKLISGEEASEGDPEWGVSRGRLLPGHRILGADDVSPATRAALQRSLVLVHGGMAQNVGPILEMVTEKYLLRSEAEWAGRREATRVLDEILAALRAGDIRRVGELTTHNFFGPLQTIIPWASNRYTEALIERVGRELGDDFWGFWMLGGMAGGGMGFIVAPERHAEAQERLQAIMSETKAAMQHALPFAMEPVVYDFAINERGTCAELLAGEQALMPPGYYALAVPPLLRRDPRALGGTRRAELDRFAAACRERPELSGMVQTLFDRMLPRARAAEGERPSLEALLSESGFDRAQHEQIRADLRAGRIGLLQNRLPASAEIRDVEPGDVAAYEALTDEHRRLGAEALAAGAAAVVSLAGGAGSRWTQGAGVVKALNPFAKLAGRHRSFLEVHLAKTRRSGREHGVMPPHVITTSYLTDGPIEAALLAARDASSRPFGHPGPIYPSPGRAVGLRLVPMARDLRFAWEETPQQRLDEQAEKVRESLHGALIGWARAAGEGGDYTDNTPLQCLHPVGHWFEVPNMLRNGVLRGLLQERPQLQHLLVHNIDTLGATLDPALLGLHRARGDALTFEVIARQVDDRGGGLARVDGQLRLLEGLAMPSEEDEHRLTFYNTLTCWVAIDKLLAAFELTRGDLEDEAKVAQAVRALAARIPTYVTLKDVKKRWGHGQEDVFPVAQWEKLWGDMTALPELACGFAAVPRARGQQLKDPAQLDGWLRDGSAAHVEALCDFG